MIYIVPQKTTAQVSVSFQLFYDNLSAHGHWIDDPNYGYVWSPNVAYGFTPYCTNGYWVYTDYGWTWASNYSWGWAPFHYGRWYFDSYYGWLWAPDTVWGPGWVTWRRSDGFYGWTAISPGISMEIAYSSGYNVPYNQWIFVRDRDFGRRNTNSYYVNTSKNVAIFKNSTVINNIRTHNSIRGRYNAGPDREDVKKHSGNAIAQISLRERNKPGQLLNKNEMQLYRPNVDRGNNEGNKLRPSEVRTRNEMTPFEDRKAEFEAKERKQVAERERTTKMQQSQEKMREQRKEQPAKRNEVQPRNGRQIDKPEMAPTRKEDVNRKNERQMNKPEVVPLHKEDRRNERQMNRPEVVPLRKEDRNRKSERQMNKPEVAPLHREHGNRREK
ncbi:DUF6600 domain-containing protein [Flavobacterium sp.]|uniref:DUF6600 domain-containing protein n=1 Tax=Flavobacterium sp. TaxID=239 RepID=UPI003D6BEB4E